jgi:hypothetical protein
VQYSEIYTLHPFTTQYMCAPCHERCITKMMSKQLTSLNILGLYLHFGSAKGYYIVDGHLRTYFLNVGVAMHPDVFDDVEGPRGKCT